LLSHPVIKPRATRGERDLVKVDFDLSPWRARKTRKYLAVPNHPVV